MSRGLRAPQRVEHAFYILVGVGHYQHPDRIITARLQGAACRLAGWRPPTGPARGDAVEELRAIATVTPKPRRGSPHAPLGRLRGDLLAEAAGLLLGTAPLDHPERNRGAAELLVEAGADRGLLDHWIGVGRARAPVEDPPFSRPRR